VDALLKSVILKVTIELHIGTYSFHCEQKWWTHLGW